MHDVAGCNEQLMHAVDARVFGVELEAAYSKSAVSLTVKVPCVVWKCLDFIKFNNGPAL